MPKKLKFTKELNKEQFHIIDGKIEKSYYQHPLNGNPDKTHLKKIINEKLGLNLIEVQKNIYKVSFLDEERFIYLDTTDGGGRKDGSQKISFPFSKKEVQNLIKENKIISVINFFFPLKKIGDNMYELDKKVIILFLSPIRYISSDIYRNIMKNGSGKFNSSNSWISIEKIYDYYKNNSKSYSNPKKYNPDWKKELLFNNYIFGGSIEAISKEDFYAFDSKYLEEHKLEELEHKLEEFQEVNKNNLNVSYIWKKDNYIVERRIFRNKLYIEGTSKCNVETCNVTASDLLIASHIKPVKDIKNSNALNSTKKKQISDPKNGFLFCKKHDATFDRGYSTILLERDGHFHICEKCREKILDLINDSEKWIQKF